MGLRGLYVSEWEVRLGGRVEGTKARRGDGQGGCRNAINLSAETNVLISLLPNLVLTYRPNVNNRSTELKHCTALHRIDSLRPDNLWFVALSRPRDDDCLRVLECGDRQVSSVHE